MKTKLNSKSQPNKKKGNTSLSASKAITKCNKLLDSPTLKSVLLLVVSIVLILILICVYKYYTSTENFETQEPIDLIDRLKNNIYENREVWSNYLYNQQPNKNENPLTFWKVSRDDNTYKYIGNAISTTVNSTTGKYTPTKESTMLVQGDTKAPESSRLVFELPHNLITTKILNDNNNSEIPKVYKNLESVSDIDTRLELLKNTYNLLLQTKQNLVNTINSKVNDIKAQTAFDVELYGIGKYFYDPEIKAKLKLNSTSRLGNGRYNGIKLPLGCSATIEFNNGFTAKYESNINNLLNNSKTAFNTISSDMIFDNNINQSIFNNSNFNLFGPYGLTKPNDGINNQYQDGDPNKKLLSWNVRIARRKGANKDISQVHEFPFNYIVNNNALYPSASGLGKNSIFKYINQKLIDKKLSRDTYISDDSDEPSGKFVMRGDGTNKTIYILNYEPAGSINVTRDPTLNGNGTYNVIQGDKNNRYTIPITELQDTKKEFTNIETFEQEKTPNYYNVKNAMLDVDDKFISVELIIGNIFHNLITKLDMIQNTVWGKDLIEINQYNLYNNDYNNILDIDESKLDKYITLSGSNKESKISINIPWIYMYFYLKYPEYRYDGNLIYGSGQVRKAFKGTSDIWDMKDGVSKRRRNRERIQLLSAHNGYRNCHNIKEISDPNVFIKSIIVNTNIDDNNLIFYNVMETIKKDKLDLLTLIENKLVMMSNNLNNLKAQIQSNNYKHYPMKIYRPVAPKYYKTVGDVIMSLDSYSTEDDYNKYTNEPILAEIACVPEQCVREIREWLPIDKVYEYQEGNKYLAIYKNPYLQSFRAVTKPGVLPPGKVEKIVACVDRCELVDDLIQADKCAQTFYKAHKAVNDTYNLDPDNILHERKSNIYKNKIVDRQNRIETLKEVARRLQVQDDKANMINKAHNRHKLQNLVDTQKANMFKLVDNLEKGKNRIDINVKFDYDIASGTLNELCKEGKLPPAVCDKLNNILDNSARRALQLTGDDRTQFDRQTLDALLRNCPTPDMENLFKRSLVESNCGCYFNDSELEIA